MQIKPVGERLILKKIKPEEKTSSGIIISNINDKKNNNMAEVIEIGTGDKIENIKNAGVNIGSKVFFKEDFENVETENNGEQLIIIDADKIIAVIE